MYCIREVAKERCVPVKEKLKVLVPLAFGVGEEVFVEFAGTLTNVDGSFKLAGSACVILDAACCRCLLACETPLEFDVEERFVKEGAEVKCVDDIVFKDEKIDLLPALEKNLLSNIPMKFLCNEGCKGLCALCGNDLNHVACDCEEEPHGVFAELLDKMKNDDIGGV
jgi:uncharacterized protein